MGLLDFSSLGVTLTIWDTFSEEKLYLPLENEELGLDFKMHVSVLVLPCTSLSPASALWLHHTH